MSYQLQARDNLLTHGSDAPLFLHDLFDELEPDVHTDTLVNSGDCFIVLAMQLDAAIEQLITKPETAQPQLEQLIATLLYLQRHYDIVRKTPDDAKPHP
ncbi:MAG TPA: hypothetical protein VHA37_10270 [Candidatus Saccharimonadales bacterium]|nr:hypothetical protein [Candidatus Saccharimonadales bacterium]